MNREVPTGVIYGVGAAVVVILALVAFLIIRAQGPIANPNPKGKDKLTGPPPPQAPPPWVLEKMKANQGGH
jgi:hypothetical protein